ncbi:aminoacyl-tRNA deacylase [Parenemella sanctibonifatiensis]|uniref:YbaK/aminoacyl-tRNA synthetase-associated domain-containing protein n=1 Tax=Parenemella sanctibonifatiensis TaxID=2016505 RepID=A0A255ER93_9ACTN|nr:YbaK/EbsC family protein [Parenemella sanctibonifatiensis]OYN85292.1 hypothetical protein CGZ92_10845 [Parenemella sanctibonifatiensis]OYN91972.1 hypothetical protein CGZ91_00095 [Parenemella sanctibonifatiensis]
MSDPTADPAIDPAHNPAVAAAYASGLQLSVRQHGRARSLAEAAEQRGVQPRQIVKSMVVRHGADHTIVLVPGDRVIAWPKLRAVLGVTRSTMPPADEAKEITGFARGTITPFGTRTPLPVVADELVPLGEVSVGGGAHGVAIHLAGADLLEHFGARVADVTDPDPELG